MRDWQLKPRFSDLSMLHLATAVVLEAVGLGSLAQRIEGSVLAVERLNLDGLLALWHPPAGKLSGRPQGEARHDRSETATGGGR